MSNFLPYSRQSINKDDINEVVKVLKSDYLTQGPNLEKFEFNFKKKVKSKYCLAISSATAGLHLSCLSLNLKKRRFFYGQFLIRLSHQQIVDYTVMPK